nr:hypothetical protein [Erwinia psidii]
MNSVDAGEKQVSIEIASEGFTCRNNGGLCIIRRCEAFGEIAGALSDHQDGHRKTSLMLLTSEMWRPFYYVQCHASSSAALEG